MYRYLKKAFRIFLSRQLRPKASEVLTNHLRQRNHPHWTSFLVRYNNNIIIIIVNFWPILRAHSNLSPCHLLTALSLQNWKHCSLANAILIRRLPYTILPVSTSCTIHHSRLTVCLPAWLSGSWPLPIDCVLVKRLWISWYLRLRLCGRSRNLEFTITIRCRYM